MRFGKNRTLYFRSAAIDPHEYHYGGIGVKQVKIDNHEYLRLVRSFTCGDDTVTYYIHSTVNARLGPVRLIEQ